MNRRSTLLVGMMWFVRAILALGFLPIMLVWASLVRLLPKRSRPRLFWGPVPIISVKYWSRALRPDFDADTFVWLTIRKSIDGRILTTIPRICLESGRNRCDPIWVSCGPWESMIFSTSRATAGTWASRRFGGWGAPCCGWRAERWRFCLMRGASIVRHQFGLFSGSMS